MPTEARDWLLKVLRDEIQRPKAKAGRKPKDWTYVLIWAAILSRVNEGMVATRNDASEPTSACDAVAKALAELNLTPSTFDGVKRIWLRIEKSSLPAFSRT